MQCNITQIFTKNEIKSICNVMERCQNISSKLKAKDGKNVGIYHYYIIIVLYTVIVYSFKKAEVFSLFTWHAWEREREREKETWREREDQREGERDGHEELILHFWCLLYSQLS